MPTKRRGTGPKTTRGRANRPGAQKARPHQPRVGVGAVVVRDGKVLLIRRGTQPLRGRWMVPGGTVEPGESLERALVREVREETGLVVRPQEALAIFDQVQREGSRVRYHYVIVAFLCEYVSGSAQAASDAREVAMVSPEALSAYRLTREARQVILEGLRRAGVLTPTEGVAGPKRGG